jgi:hypothetical protein
VSAGTHFPCHDGRRGRPRIRLCAGVTLSALKWGSGTIMWTWGWWASAEPQGELRYPDAGSETLGSPRRGVSGLVGNEGGVVSGVINLESSGVEAPDWRPRHDEHYHEV